MAGLPSRTKRHPQGRSARTANEEREGLPRIDIENSQGFENSPPPQRRRRNASFSPARNDLSSETASSSKQESPGQSTRLSNTSPDLLWITTDKPADFKDAKIQRMISRHVMRDYQQKDQSKKESGRSTRRKNSAKSPSDDDVSVTSTSSQLSLTPMVEISRGYSAGSPSASPYMPSRVHESVAMTQEMFYPLSIDISSVEFQQRLGHLIARYLSVWYGDHASQLCGSGNQEIWQLWMPSILSNEILLYSTAFAAVSHINFLNPEAYKAERWALKEQAIRKINQALNDVDAVENDCTIGAILGMAFVAHLENLGAGNYTTHMLGLQRTIEARGGLQALLPSETMFHALSLCDLSGTIIYGTRPVLLSRDESRGLVTSQGQMDISHGLLDSPLQCYGDFSKQPGYSGLRSDTVQILNGMRRLTHIFEAAYSQDILGDSVFLAQCASIESRLDSFPPANDALSSLPGDHVYEACRIASLIYLRAIMHNIPFTNPANFPLMRDLRSALENSILHGWNGFPGALLWTLLIGAATERMDSEEVFFAGHLSTTSKCIMLLWNDVQTVLKKFLWIEGVMEERATYPTEEN